MHYVKPASYKVPYPLLANLTGTRIFKPEAWGIINEGFAEMFTFKTAIQSYERLNKQNRCLHL